MKHPFSFALALIGASLAAPLAAQVAPGEQVIGAPAGNGDHPAIAFTRADAPGYTLYRPLVLPDRPMPVVLWGNGGCRDNGLSASHFLREIASHGYLVIANGNAREERPMLLQLPAAPPPSLPPASGDAPPPPPRATPDETTVTAYLAAIDWAVAANGRAGDPLHGRIDTARVAALGHSCGGLQALAAGADPRIATVIAFASGVYNRPGGGLSGVQITKDDLARLHTPVAYVIGGEGDIAFPNAADDFARIDHVPVMLANLPVGHGGTFALANGGDWARLAVEWLNWHLRGDESAARSFVGAGCRLCTSYGWSIERKGFEAFASADN